MEYAAATIDAIWLAKVRLARSMTDDDRVLAGPRMFAGVCERMKEGLRDDHPEATESEVHELLIGRLRKLDKLEPVRPPIP